MAVVTLKTGETFTCSETTILDSALSSGIVLEYSCKRGDCDSCECVLLDGKAQEPSGVRQTGDVIKTCLAKPLADCLLSAEYIAELQSIETVVSPAKVSSISRSSDIAVLKLRLPPTAKFHFIEGQYLNLSLLGVKRSYSIASTSCESQIELHVKKVEGGNMSSHIFGEVKENTLFRIEGPIGSFFVRESDRPLVFLATGTGFAPVQAMVKRLLKEGVSRPIKIYWGNRYSGDFYSDFLEQYIDCRSDKVNYYKILSQERSGRDERYVQEAAANDINDFSEYEVYACGSPKMISSAKQLLISKGLRAENFYSDAFVATTN